MWACGRVGVWAKGRAGDCHEVAKQNSPGLQPWVVGGKGGALKVASERLFGLQVCNSFHAMPSNP
jgi:hypothetical protein